MEQKKKDMLCHICRKFEKMEEDFVCCSCQIAENRLY